MKRLNVLLTLALLALAVFGAAGGQTRAQGKPFDGVTIDVLTFTGPQIAEPLQRRAPDFKELTGATVNVVTVPFSELYQKILTDAATKTNSFDGYVFAPQWMVDYAVPGYLEDLTERVKADADLKWDDVAPFFRDFSASFGGKVLTIPVDGDFHMVYYRTDVLKDLGMNAPKTWDDYLAIAKAANGKDMNGDGNADYGSCIAKKKGEQGYWWISSIASGFIQSKGTSQGGFFDAETMKPLVNNEGFIRALDIYKETNQYGPPNELSIGVGDTRGLFTAGQCALTLDWGDIGSLSVDAENSKVIDKVGAVILPGSSKIVDRATGKLVDCTADLCPHAIDGINHAPFAAFGGWSGGINAGTDDKSKEATFAFFSYMSQPAQANVDVTIGRTGFNPYRTSQFEQQEAWIAGGFSKEFADNYLGAIKASLNSPNMMLDLRVPQNQRYQQVVLDDAIARFLAGEYDAAGAAADIEKQWEEITDELGRDAQKSAYLSTLGVQR
jgi:multiple sugar transport system substrate-binding protein